jgi:hypothetical protein
MASPLRASPLALAIAAAIAVRLGLGQIPVSAMTRPDLTASASAL